MVTPGMELKQPPMKAQVFKPDEAILARIKKSQQQAQAGRGGHRNGSGNQQGYTGTFGRLSNNGDNRNGGRRNDNRGGNGGNGGNNGGRTYTGRTGGFTGSSMQDAFNASNGGGQGFGGQNQAGKGGKPQNGRHGQNDKNRRGNGKDRQDQQMKHRNMKGMAMGVPISYATWFSAFFWAASSSRDRSLIRPQMGYATSAATLPSRTMT